MKARSDIRAYRALTDKDSAIIAKAEKFADEVIAPRAAEWETTRQAGLPRDVVDAWVDANMIDVNVRPEHGGQGASFLAKIGIGEVLARQCLSSAFALVNIQNGPSRISNDGTPEQVERYLPDMRAARIIQSPCLSEPHCGSDFAALKTTATRVDGGWRLTGTKAWATNALIGNTGLVYAQSEPGSRGKGIGGFLVHFDREGAEVGAPYDLSTGSVIGAADIMLNDYFVPDNDVFYAPGNAFKRALSSINRARTYVAALACGMVSQALHVAVAYGRDRTTFAQPVVAHQGIRWSVADIATDLEAARLLTYQAANLIDEGKDAMMAAAMAKKYAVEMAERRLPNCLQIMGAAGLRAEYPTGRHILSAKIASFVDGSTEIQSDRIGRLLSAE